MMLKVAGLFACRRWLLTLAAGLGMVSCSTRVPVEKLLAEYESGQYPALVIHYPPSQAVFPPDIVPPRFAWQETNSPANAWLVVWKLGASAELRHFFSERPEWTPSGQDWEELKQSTREKAAQVTILGLNRAAPEKIISRGQLTLSTSKDPVAAPIFYREVNLPFLTAVKDPTRIRWRFGSISQAEPPRVVLEHLAVCGNCHSFSRDGGVLGMDVDYANNKGSYMITRVAKEMRIATSDIITWDDYKKEEQQKTFGLLSQVSPDGQVVVSTVKDKSVFVARPDLAFSQLFFPIKGILATYRRDKGTFQALPGADDPEYAQSNPAWSPDGQYIVFARARRYELKNPKANEKLLLSEEDCAEFLRDGKPFLFDLYRVPYNGGQGGKAEPLAGAAHNGRSNFFPKFSPDGQWIIYCQAKSYMLLQPDSELYIIPAAGGTARRLSCNTPRMNSWHSWSPNSRWLVFSSKASTPYTQLFLTHIDEQGESTPPIVLENFTAPDRAANIPEFVNVAPEAIQKIHEPILNDSSYARAGYVYEVSGDVERALAEYRKAVGINSQNQHAHQRLGFLLYNAKKQFKEGMEHTLEALRLDPNDGCAHYDMAMAQLHQERLDAAINHLTKAAQLLPEGFDRRYHPANINYSLGSAWLAKGDIPQAIAAFTKAAEAGPKNAQAHYALALAMASQGMTDEPAKHYGIAQSLQPELDTVPELPNFLSLNQARAGQWAEALKSAERGLALARAAGNQDLAQEIEGRLPELRQKSGAR